MSRPFVKLTALLLAAFLILMPGAAQPLQAHASFARAEPPPNSVLPEHTHLITIWFTEPLEPGFSEIQVLDASGQRVDSGNSQILEDDPMAMSVSLPTLPDGTYTVAWRNVSTVDGHSLRGSYVLSFGEAMSGAPTEATSTVERAPFEPLARGLTLIGALAVAGGLLFERLLILPIFFKAGAAPETVALGNRLVRRARRVMWLALLLFIIGSVVQLVGQAATLFNVSLGEMQMLYVNVILRTTDWGGLWLWRLWLFSVLAIYMLASALIAAPLEAEDEDLVTRIAGAIALAAALALLLVISLTSHAAAMGSLRIPALISDYLHMLASAVWVGGLFHFALAAYPLFQLEAAQRGALLAELVPRFSTLAILSVGTLIITGLYSSWAQVGVLPALLTPYGLTLLGKLALLVPLLLLGAVNLLRVSPELRSEPKAGSLLKRIVSVEALLGLAILLVVGLLTGSEPARQAAAREGIGQERTLTFEDSVEGAQIEMALEPALTGENRLTVQLQDVRGRPITNASDILIELSYLDTDLGPTSLRAEAGEEEGEYVVSDVFFSVAGNWQAALLVQRPDAFDARTAFRFEVRTGEALEASTQTGYLLFGLELFFLGILFGAVSVPLGSWRTRPGLTLAAPAALALVAGLVFVLGAPMLSESIDAPLVNPFPPTSDSVATGEEVYMNVCTSCHGPTGLGDGPAGAGLNPPPADLVFHVPLHPDSELYMTILEGKPGTGMPAFKDQLSEEQIWHLVNFLRTLPE